jgi:hypothetical protein
MFAGGCWWRSLAVDGSSGTSRGHGSVMRRPGSRWDGVVERPSVFQAGHIPSWQESYESYALSPIVVACRWSLPLLSTRRKLSIAIGPAACRGWPASGPGRRWPGPWFLAGVSAEAPGSSMTSRTFTRHLFMCSLPLRPQSCLRLEGRKRTLRRPSPDLRPARSLAPSRIVGASRSTWRQPGAPTLLTRYFPRKALAAQAGRG